MEMLMAKRDEGRRFLLVENELLTIDEVTERHLPLSYFRLIDVDVSTLYWFFGAQFTDSEDYTVIAEYPEDLPDGLIHHYRYNVEFYTPYRYDKETNLIEILTQDRNSTFDSEMWHTIRREAKWLSRETGEECNVFITRQKRGECVPVCVGSYSTNRNGQFSFESWLDRTLYREKGYGFCYNDNAPEECESCRFH